MAHDDDCEMRQPLMRWLGGCRCGSRAFWADPIPAADLAMVVEDLTWDGT